MRPGTVTDPPAGATRDVMRAAYFDPTYVSVLKYQNEIIVFLLVSAGLALLVRRSRALVAERAEAERARGNLARYFSPKVVETLAERDEPLGRVRRQAVGGLFADLVGFTTMAEEMTPEEVMALLRDFHGRMEEEVFRHGGCLEKFIGDALLATFGVPDTGRRDATDALACARGMLAALAAWNVEREAAGLQPLQMGLGLHYGPVVAGDIGSRRSMAYATVGDTTNVTSRLQSLTRELRVAIVASAALVAAVEQEAADLTLLHGLTSRRARGGLLYPGRAAHAGWSIPALLRRGMLVGTLSPSAGGPIGDAHGSHPVASPAVGPGVRAHRGHVGDLPRLLVAPPTARSGGRHVPRRGGAGEPGSRLSQTLRTLRRNSRRPARVGSPSGLRAPS